MLTKAIESKVDALWDKFWSGGIANPLTAMEQISYLLFMRRLDETDRKRESLMLRQVINRRNPCPWRPPMDCPSESIRIADSSRRYPCE